MSVSGGGPCMLVCNWSWANWMKDWYCSASLSCRKCSYSCRSRTSSWAISRWQASTACLVEYLISRSGESLFAWFNAEDFGLRGGETDPLANRLRGGEDELGGLAKCLEERPAASRKGEDRRDDRGGDPKEAEESPKSRWGTRLHCDGPFWGSLSSTASIRRFVDWNNVTQAIFMANTDPVSCALRDNDKLQRCPLNLVEDVPEDLQTNRNSQARSSWAAKHSHLHP